MGLHDHGLMVGGVSMLPQHHPGSVSRNPDDSGEVSDDVTHTIHAVTHRGIIGATRVGRGGPRSADSSPSYRFKPYVWRAAD